MTTMHAPRSLSKSALEAFPAETRILLFGTGEGGRGIHESICDHTGLTVHAFIDSTRTGSFQGIPIIGPSDVVAFDRADTVIVLASQFWADLLKLLPPLENARIYNGYPLIMQIQRLAYFKRVESTPFIVMLPGGGEETATPVPTSDDLRALAERKQAGSPGLSALLSAMAAVLDQDVWVAAACLDDWLADPLTRSVPTLLKPARNGPTPDWLLRIDTLAAPPSAAEKSHSLSLVQARATENGLLYEAAGLSRARLAAAQDDLGLARALLEDLLKRNPADPAIRHIHENALTAVMYRENKWNLPANLAIYLEGKSEIFSGLTCSKPFQRFDIHTNGDVLVCCGHYIRKSIGNVFMNKHDEIMNSEAAKDIRRSVLNGEFKYCNLVRCAEAVSGHLPKKELVTEPLVRAGLDTGTVEVASPVSVVFAIDQTCNLTCPSCRNELIIEKGSEREKKIKAIDDVIIPIIRQAQLMELSTAGEVFVSKPARHLLGRLNRVDFPNLQVNIISNGMLFTPEEWEKFPGVHDMVGYVRISTDAATAATFEKLRRGGDHKVFCENMKFISSLRRDGVVKEFFTSFTYQLDNFREMPDFVKWSRDLGCDHVNFEKLENITFDEAEYLEMAVHKPSHPLYNEFLRVLAHPEMHDPMVRIDYDLTRVPSEILQ